MTDRIDNLESRLDGIERRLRALEGVSNITPIEDESTLVAPAIGEGFLGNAATHLGRVLLIFGGAYFLRAITDAQFVPTGVGILMGASYALLWLFLCYRSGARDDQRASAVFYGGTSVLLALPLLVEAITRFDLLSGTQGAVALTVFCALTMLVAALRDLRSIGWLITVGGLATGLVLVKNTHTAVPVAVFLLLLGLGSLWATNLRQWTGPKWLGALGADIGVVVLLLVSSSDQWTVEPIVAFVLGVALLVSYLVSFLIRSHFQRHSVGLFATFQTILALTIMFSAAGKASQAGILGFGVVGGLSLLLGASAYGLAFTPETRSVRGRNFFFYSTLGLVLVVAGTAMVMSPLLAAAVWSIMAVAMAWLSGRFTRVALSLQCTFLLIAAGVGSGILGTGIEALAGDALESWPAVVHWHLLLVLATVVCLFIPVAQHSERWGVLAGLPQLTVLALSVWEVGGLMVAYLVPVLTTVPGSEANLGVVAAVRTAILAASSVTLALSSRHKRWPEARWLAYPVLILIGVKLLVEDFPNGQPATLFVALGLVGSAMILVSKLMNRSNDKNQETTG